MQTFFVNEPMAIARKHKTVFYYGPGESEEAKRLASMERAAQRVGLTRDATMFAGDVENCNKVVILSAVPSHYRKKIEGAYGGDLIKMRGSDGWVGGEVVSAKNPADAAVIIPQGLRVSGPKANPEDVSPQNANPPAALPHHIVEQDNQHDLVVRSRRGRNRKLKEL